MCELSLRDYDEYDVSMYAALLQTLRKSKRYADVRVSEPKIHIPVGPGAFCLDQHKWAFERMRKFSSKRIATKGRYNAPNLQGLDIYGRILHTYLCDLNGQSLRRCVGRLIQTTENQTRVLCFYAPRKEAKKSGRMVTCTSPTVA